MIGARARRWQGGTCGNPRAEGLLLIDQTSIDTNISVATASIGFASLSSQEGGIGIALSPNGATTSDTYVRQRTDNAIVEIKDTGAQDMLADLQSFDSGGFTINKTASADATVIHFLALKGGKYRVGYFDKRRTLQCRSIKP